MFHSLFSWIRRLAFGRRPLVLAIATSVALAVVFLFVAAPSAAAQSPTPAATVAATSTLTTTVVTTTTLPAPTVAPSAPVVPPACSTQIQGTRYTLPAMKAGQEATVPVVPGAIAVCIEALEGKEGIAIKLKGTSPYLAEGNATPLTVDSEFATNMALSDPSFNGSLLKATPALPGVTVVALTDLSDEVTVWVGTPRAPVVTTVVVDQWADVRIPGALGELKAGTTKYAGNGVPVKVTSGAAYYANGAAMLPDPGKSVEFEFFVDGVYELELKASVPGQRFYLSVDADAVTADSWLQKRVEAKASPAAVAAASTAGAQYVNLSGACYTSATCSAAQAVACVSGAPKLPCTPGDQLQVWRAPAYRPYLPLLLKP